MDAVATEAAVFAPAVTVSSSTAATTELVETETSIVAPDALPAVHQPPGGNNHAAILDDLRTAVREFLKGADLSEVTVRVIRDALPARFAAEVPQFSSVLKSVAVEELSAATQAHGSSGGPEAAEESSSDSSDGSDGEDEDGASGPSDADSGEAGFGGPARPAKKRRSGGGGAFSRPVQLSTPLAEFLGSADGLMPRAAVTKALWAYIKEKLPRCKGGWTCDERLAAVLKRRTVNFGSLNKALVQHLKDPALLVDAPPPPPARGGGGGGGGAPPRAKARAAPAARVPAVEGGEEEEEGEGVDEEQGGMSDIDSEDRGPAAGAKRPRVAPAKPARKAPSRPAAAASASTTKAPASSRPSREERALAAAAAAAAPPKPPRAKAAGGASGGFGAPQLLSPELAAVVGSPTASRSAAVKAIWAYVRAHDLQKPSDKRVIVCDAALSAVMRRAEVGCFAMNKELSRHFLGPAPQAARGDAAEAGSGAVAASAQTE